MTDGSTLGLYNSSLRNHSNGVLNCLGTGTTYAALLDVELTDRLFAFDPNCVGFSSSLKTSSDSLTFIDFDTGTLPVSDE